MTARYTIVGAGAIGGTLAVHLHHAGVEVQLVDADPEHVAAIREHGLRIEQPDSVLTAQLPVFLPEEAPEELGAVLLAVKAQATDAVAGWIAPRLRADGWVASMQNGLNEATIAAHVGPERTVAAFVDLFADVIGPGVVKDGGIGAIALGEHAGPVSDRVRALAHDLRHWGEAIVTDNVEGFLWSKLGFGAMLVATALADDDMGLLIDRHRPGMHALVREVLAVATAEGKRLESFDAFVPASYLGSEAEADAATDALVAWLATQTKKRSGIWRDIAVRGRRTEVPTQYQPVVDAGERHGIATPLTAWMIDAIVRLETGDAQMAEAHLDELDRLAAA